MGTFILQEETYHEQMTTIVEPYLQKRMTEKYLEREEGKPIYCVRYKVRFPKGTVLISHGFTENLEKYQEVIYYFLKKKYQVYFLEHCGHGRSYRLVDDMSLVHVDTYERYVEDFLFVARKIRKKHGRKPFYLFAHSMGGGIGVAATSREPWLFDKLVLSSPMIRPAFGSMAWHDVKVITEAFCKAGRSEDYVIGKKPFTGPKAFEFSSGVCEVQHDYYQTKRVENSLLQTTAPSYGWLQAAIELHDFLQKEAWKGIRVPVLMFQAERDQLVSNKEQERFLIKVRNAGNKDAKLVRVPKTKHETFNSDRKTTAGVWRMIFLFLER